MNRVRVHANRGFTLVELLMALAIGAAVIGATAVGFGTLARATGRVGGPATITLTASQISNFYGVSATAWNTNVAPNPGATAAAEDMRERFLADTMAATAVYCLSRTDINTFRPGTIAFNPQTDTYYPETSEDFRKHLLAKSLISAAAFTSTRNVNTTAQNASIFVIGYSSDPLVLQVSAIYEIDVVKTTVPQGFFASVRRYVATATTAAQLTAYYDVFYPAVDATTWPTTTDNFAPLWVAFERANRTDMSLAESVAIQRFKIARERPFYFVWWPDPNAQSLGMYRASNTAYAATDPRNAYNHMGGRTSYMFTVPVFPAL
jgi:prepilin-type N-terminal cleavage/methylation domain-containing protein